MFNSSYERFFRDNDPNLRLVIIQILERLMSMGLLPIHKCNHIVLCYLCDPNEQVRGIATKVISSVNTRFVFSNFREVLVEVVKYIEGKYGELTVVGEGSEFLLEPLHNRIMEELRVVGKAERRGRATLVKKMAEVFTGSVESMLKSELLVKSLNFVCLILNRVNQFEINEFKELVVSLSHFYTMNEHQVERALGGVVSWNK